MFPKVAVKTKPQMGVVDNAIVNQQFLMGKIWYRRGDIMVSRGITIWNGTPEVFNKMTIIKECLVKFVETNMLKTQWTEKTTAPVPC